MNTGLQISMIISASLLALGCSGSTETHNNCQAFSSTFAIKDRMGQTVSSFTQGEDIFFEGRITNTTLSNQSLDAGGGCSQIIFEARNDTETVWGDHDRIACIQAITRVEYTAGETKTFNASWDQMKRDSNAAEIGEYTGHLVDSTPCSATLNKSAPFSIQ